MHHALQIGGKGNNPLRERSVWQKVQRILPKNEKWKAHCKERVVWQKMQLELQRGVRRNQIVIVRNV